MGVLLFIMVQGKFPHGTHILKDKYYNMIRHKSYEQYFKAVDATRCSKGFKELIVSLLAYNPTERPSIETIRQSAFFRNSNYCAQQTQAALKTKILDILSTKTP